MDQPQMQQSLTKALNELREGVAATKRVLLERCQIAEGEASNSEALTGTRSAAA